LPALVSMTGTKPLYMQLMPIRHFSREVLYGMS